MKNILIIAKIEEFKQQPSINRVKLLEHLLGYSNIKVLNDAPYRKLKAYLKNQKKRKWKPDIILYYFLSQQSKWTTISIPDFDTTHKEIPRIMFFEDFHYYDTVYKLFKKHNFKYLLKSIKHITTDNKYHQLGIKFKTLGTFINTDHFKNHNATSYEYDFLLYGFINFVYPLRYKIYKCLTILKRKLPNIRIKIIKHPGYGDISKIEKLPKEEELSKIINKSRFTLVTSSNRRLLVKKYFEVPLSHSTLIGDIPIDYINQYKKHQIEIPYNSSEDEILTILQDAYSGKYSEIEKNKESFANELSETCSFSNSYIRLNEVCEEILKSV